jgi:hypothetical protein
VRLEWCHPEERKRRGTTTTPALCAAFVRRLPPMEAVPAKLVRGADLIWVAVGINPALLLRSPTAVPRKLDHARLSAAFDRHRSDKVRATGPRVDVQSIDDPLRVGVQQLVDEPDHLDSRHRAREGDRWRLGATRKGEQICLESVSRARTAEDLSVDRHGRNISGDRLIRASLVSSRRTKLTAGSARAIAR